MFEYCLVGLGNPGRTYTATRHNLGWQVIDALAQTRLQTKFSAALATITLADKNVLLVKPTTFMNRSGLAVQQIAAFYNLTPERIWIIHDDIDLSFGTLRISRGRSAAGHRGVDSVLTAIHSRACVRFRMGIRPEHPFDTEAFVLERFSAAEKKLLPAFIKRTVAAVTDACAHSPEHAANHFN
ncbi:MAG: aminoacyl-tRNA hydrolase [Candidatus Kerfeldbacteria bacterium]|nr:aminoacyl-tRNA hydrolase [Candidatus Kerfeldbacteria bacterium]